MRNISLWEMHCSRDYGKCSTADESPFPCGERELFGREAGCLLSLPAKNKKEGFRSSKLVFTDSVPHLYHHSYLKSYRSFENCKVKTTTKDSFLKAIRCLKCLWWWKGVQCNSLQSIWQGALIFARVKLPDGSTRLTVFHTFPILRVFSEKQLYLAHLLLFAISLFSSTGINTSTALLGFITHNVLAKDSRTKHEVLVCFVS